MGDESSHRNKDDHIQDERSWDLEPLATIFSRLLPQHPVLKALPPPLSSAQSHCGKAVNDSVEIAGEDNTVPAESDPRSTRR